MKTPERRGPVVNPARARRYAKLLFCALLFSCVVALAPQVHDRAVRAVALFIAYVFVAWSVPWIHRDE